MRPGENNDLFVKFAGKFSFGRGPKIPQDEWMKAVSGWSLYYRHRRVSVAEWDNPLCRGYFVDQVPPNEAYHAIIDGLEYEFEPDLEAHADDDVLDAQALVGQV